MRIQYDLACEMPSSIRFVSLVDDERIVGNNLNFEVHFTGHWASQGEWAAF